MTGCDDRADAGPAVREGPAGALVADQPVAGVEAGGVFRSDLGDIGALADSIRRMGLLSPIVITNDRLLVSGRRRLAAAGLLGWETIPAWVAQGVSGRLRRVLAIRDCEELRKALTPVEQAELYGELEALYAAEAARRRQATQFQPKHPAAPTGRAAGGGPGGSPGPRTSPPAQPPTREDTDPVLAADPGDSHGTAGAPGPEGVGGGPGESPGPWAPAGPPAAFGDPRRGEARVQAARRVTGTDSHQRLERINELRAIAADPAEEALVREAAADALVELNHDGKVAARWERVKLAQQTARLRRTAHDPAAPETARQQAAAALDRIVGVPDTGTALREAKRAVFDVGRLRAPQAATAAPPNPDAGARRGIAQLVEALRREHGWWDRHDPAVFARLATDQQWELVAGCARGAARFWDAAQTARRAQGGSGR
jgi:ParB family chromosome partitioning protein